jgi:hypothetical protein
MGLPEGAKLAELLRTLAAAVESLSPSELREFADNLGKRITTSFDDTERSSPRDDVNRTRISTIMSELHGCETRDEALSLMKVGKLSRRELIEVARTCSVHIAKDDNISRIEEKVVEAIVGSRLNSNAIRGSSFAAVNARIVAQTNTRIMNEIKGHRFKFVFNPESGASKFLTFETNGEIGEGRNRNEYAWSIFGGRLEIKNDQGRTYSRFSMTPEGKFYHTNDPDTLSIKGQYLEPI